MSKFNLGMRACALFLLWGTISASLPAQTFTTLHRFNNTDGYYPLGMLVQANDGNLYGTTASGGTDDEGTVFKITLSGTLTTLHGFDVTDGYSPLAGLVQDAKGNFYGTTEQGGTGYYGTAFKITPSGRLTTLHNFDRTDGYFLSGGLVRDSKGNLYGTTFGGGAHGGGTVFKITPSDVLTILFTFCAQMSQSGCTDGLSPWAGLAQDSNGNFYGTTYFGGSNYLHPYLCGSAGCGTIFKITPSGNLTRIYKFCSQIKQGGCPDGQFPQAALVQGTDGAFYGTTYAGGANTSCYSGYGCGTIFKVTPNGNLTTIYSFCSQLSKNGCQDGNEPSALIQGTDGNFYGTTYAGGANDGNHAVCNAIGCGTIFKITPSGTLTTLYTFCIQFNKRVCSDGAQPFAGLVQYTDGKFYGTTTIGGFKRGFKQNRGTVFSLSVGLGPFVETRPAFGEVGAAIRILGTDLTGATSVIFNGTAATFTVKSKSEITTTVPTGATTGTVQVVTSGGTLSSNAPFTVN